MKTKKTLPEKKIDSPKDEFKGGATAQSSSQTSSEEPYQN